MSNEIVVRPKASQQLAALIGMEPGAMLETIKAQCFKCNPANVTNEQLAAFVSIAAEMGLNPLLPGFLYAYPISGGGVVPIMGPDGIYKKLTEHPEIDSWETEVFPADVALPPTHAITRIWRKSREKPLSYTAVFSEWKINSNPNWNTRPRHMLALRSLKHAARQLIHGLPGDEDDRHIMGEINVTPGADNAPAAEQQQKRSDPPARAKKEKGVSAATAEASKAIDVDVVPPKTETPPPPVQEKAAEKAAEKIAEKAPEPEKEKPAEKAAPAAKSGPRTSLQEGEVLTARCTVKGIFAMNINVEGTQTPSVHAKVEGEFSGPVYHFGAAKKQGEEGLVPNRDEWAVGNEVVLQLFGRVNKKTGSVIARVDKLELAEAQTDTSAIDV